MSCPCTITNGTCCPNPLSVFFWKFIVDSLHEMKFSISYIVCSQFQELKIKCSRFCETWWDLTQIYWRYLFLIHLKTLTTPLSPLAAKGHSMARCYSLCDFGRHLNSVIKTHLRIYIIFGSDRTIVIYGKYNISFHFKEAMPKLADNYAYILCQGYQHPGQFSVAFLPMINIHAVKIRFYLQPCHEAQASHNREIDKHCSGKLM